MGTLKTKKTGYATGAIKLRVDVDRRGFWTLWVGPFMAATGKGSGVLERAIKAAQVELPDCLAWCKVTLGEVEEET